MTHDELLKKIDSWQHSDCCALLMDGYCDCPFKALRAAVELHKPKLDDVGRPVCSECTINLSWKHYPCLTIQAIEKELT